MNKYKAYNLLNFKQIPQVKKYLTSEQIRDIETVGTVLPFKANNYVIDELIDWNNIPNDPIFQLTFPQRGMLSDEHYKEIAQALNGNHSKQEINFIANKIRFELNPHPAGQFEHNVPELNGVKLKGIQHKYRETVLFFPAHSQTCHAYCTFCFRWPQFVGIDDLKFAMKEVDLLVKYLNSKPEVTDLLFTGGDPMVMNAGRWKAYLEPFLKGAVPHLRNIRIGTKSLTYWPYRYLTDKDSDEILRLFESIVKAGFHLTIMAHFNHPNELKTEAVRKATERILNTGAKIRTQAPVMNHINANPNVWSEMWKKQVKMGMIPYYMFVARDTGAQDYFAVTLNDAWNIFRNAYSQVSGIVRTVRGPVMSASPGKVQILGVNKIFDQKVFVLRFIQGRNPEWVGKPFFAQFNPEAIWLNDLMPASGKDEFFFEEELQEVA